MHTRWTFALALVACGPPPDDAPPPDPAEDACLKIADGRLTDTGPTPEEAPLLEVGPDPYRLLLFPNQSSYVQVSTDAGTLTLMSTQPDVTFEVTAAGTALTMPPSQPNPTCPDDIQVLVDVDVPAGDHLITVGPSYVATAWVAFGFQ